MNNKIIFKFILLLWIIGIVWNAYSYVCMEITYRYNMYEIYIIPSLSDNLYIMWKSFRLLVFINSSMIFLSFIERLIKNNKNIRQVFYMISIITTILFNAFWEINYRKLLQAMDEGSNLLTHILRPGHYGYIIVILIITILLLLLEELKSRDSRVGESSE